MFYTGVDPAGNQSIGYVTTPLLGKTAISWTRFDSPVYRATDAGWAHDEVPQQFRDPFIMPDPDVVKYPGRYLLFNAGEDVDRHPFYTIGVARNRTGTLQQWDDLGNYEATDHAHLALAMIESPLVVRDSLTGAWRMFVANAWYDTLGHYSTVFLTETVGDSLTDTRASAWPQRDWLYYYVGEDADVIGWQACEHLQVGEAHLFAAFQGDGIGITRMHWDPVAQKFFIVHPIAAVGGSPERAAVRFAISDLLPNAGLVRFTLESPGPFTPQVTVYDVAGRHVRRLTDNRTMPGRGEVTWDCRDESGHSVAAGIYFARLTGVGKAPVLRVPIIR
jgi:hypothetical protein